MLTFGIQDLGKWLGDEVDAATGAADPNSSGPGARFLSRATDMDYIGEDRDLAVRTIESAARFAELGAVARMTMAASDAAGGAVTRRTTLANLRGGLKTARLDGAPERPKDGLRKRQKRGPKYRKFGAPKRPKDGLRKRGQTAHRHHRSQGWRNLHGAGRGQLRHCQLRRRRGLERRQPEHEFADGAADPPDGWH
ncbi:MAG: hypothetical protein LBN96_05680 [Desulfovibrio sp.]|nr:hypothetical protein [Desulfovibrio sp.]